ncbi:PfkB family carbohydrate kinase [Nocardioides sambongensis]|uniref:PfkB family carbohydrate kinase n=1 Tax=Nocardioides sambongensis TaxID=2589074 RepID=UPI001127F6F0|nr:PfkB family carbohydrate kinase [Nocardioides sambongensis]
MTGTTEPDVLVVGEALIDVVERPGRPTARMPGGSPANVALALGRLGRRTRLATVLGRDDDAELLRGWLAESDVAVEATPASTGRTSTARAVLNDSGSATYDFDLAWEPVQVRPGPIGVLHIGSIASVLAPGADAVRDLVRRARDGALVSFDPNARPSITPDRDAVLSRVLELVALSDVVKVSEEDLAWYDPARVRARWPPRGLASGRRSSW